MYGRHPESYSEIEYLEGMLGREATQAEIDEFFGGYDDFLDSINSDDDDTPPSTPSVLPVVAQQQELVKAVSRNVEEWLLRERFDHERESFYRDVLRPGAIFPTRNGTFTVIYVSVDGVTPDTAWPHIIATANTPNTIEHYGLEGTLGLPVQRVLIDWHTGNKTNTSAGTRSLTSLQWRWAYGMHLRYASRMALRRAKTRYSHFYWMSGVRLESEGRKWRLQCEMVKFSRQARVESRLLLAA